MFVHDVGDPFPFFSFFLFHFILSLFISFHSYNFGTVADDVSLSPSSFALHHLALPHLASPHPYRGFTMRPPLCICGSLDWKISPPHPHNKPTNTGTRIPWPSNIDQIQQNRFVLGRFLPSLFFFSFLFFSFSPCFFF